VIIGSHLSDPNVPLQLQDTTQGLPLTLNGTSLSVTIGGTTVHPAIYYSTPTQVAAELPAATPAGSGTITVSHGGDAQMLFEIFSQRYERSSTLVASNLPFAEWTEVLGSERLAGALLDRLTHHVHILEMNGDGFRLKNSRKKKNPGPH
jgi:hypothetical protein